MGERMLAPFYMLNAPQIILQLELIPEDFGSGVILRTKSGISIFESRFLGKDFLYYEDEEGIIWTSLPIILASGIASNKIKEKNIHIVGIKSGLGIDWYEMDRLITTLSELSTTGGVFIPNVKIINTKNGCVSLEATLKEDAAICDDIKKYKFSYNNISCAHNFNINATKQ